ncbi:acyltransferase family protein [Desulfopila aestuarii]|uniref:Peptidoglycan/LPS O-acetylase OafA/YrhL, contains acyltransferase and SGNH-hydrolase domains n=1 Tax=Desulfopila aestuarii DSM 18488 TaxID=1121416 RepID=A0A1M7YIA0_9BACT|nr:acyltransferase [Desulfopila aestuarii]SHO52248.1 Peptidoglycan/LPS O-acetylase OafA/YrhL, contains acyltransferase and SGNH-hydrolase domains [Desulfopila aestuarii DSM 18488]
MAMLGLLKSIDNAHEINVQKQTILELNGIRGFACLLIFLFHCRVMSGSPDIRPDLGVLYLLPLHGAYAVDLFFVLSGFFIILPYAKAGYTETINFSYLQYYKKKIVRIFPPYYLNLLVMFGMVVPVFIGQDFLFSKNGLQMLLVHMSFMQYLFPATSASLGINGALWTLSITFQFFLVFPFIKQLFVKRCAEIYLVIFVVISLVWRYFSLHSHGFVYSVAMNSVAKFGVDDFTIRFFLSNQLPAQLGHFAIGMYLGKLYIAYLKGVFVPRRWVSPLMLIGFLSTLYSFQIANLAVPPWWYVWRLWLGCGSGCLIYLAVIDGPGWIKHFFRNRYFGYLGDLSYEIYLWHLMILYVLINTIPMTYFSGNRLFWLCVLVGGGLTITVSRSSVKLLVWFRHLWLHKVPH